MSVFSSSVKSQIIDPVFTSKTRCEFRLANRGEAYLPTMRLGNLGLQKNGKNAEYHYGPGAASCINRIQLLDGNEPLDTLRNVGNWLTFKNSLHSNSQNDNVFKRLVGGNLGWATGATGELLSNDNKLIRTGGAETLGTLDLREVFPILNNISHLSTKLFTNLRVVIEYHTDTKALVNFQEEDGGAAVDGLAKVVPLLIVDEIVDDALIQSLDKQLVSASWVAIEVDQAAVPQVSNIGPTGVVGLEQQQAVNLRINGFHNKAVSRLMISKVYQNLSEYVYKPTEVAPSVSHSQMRGIAQYGSKALHKEEFNIRINGRNALAGRGVTTPAAMTMLLSDTWGDLNMCPGQNVESVGLDSKYTLTANQRQGNPLIPVHRPCANWVGSPRTYPRILNAGGIPSGLVGVAGTTWTTQPTAEQGPWIGNSAWIGVGVHDRVSDMQIQLTRTGNPSTAGGQHSSAGNYQALDVLVFGEVAKRLDVSGGSYKISYA